MPRVSDDYLEKRRRHILESAFIVFSKKGFTEATMKDVIEEAGISRGGLYAHYDNIEMLFLEALKFDDQKDKVFLLSGNENKSIIERLEEWLRDIFKEINQPSKNLVRARSEFFLRFSAEEVPYISDRRRELQKVLETFLEEGIKKKELNKDLDSFIFADLLISMVDGLMLSEVKNQSSKEILQKKWIP
ncbi:TetR/AcrR family transcriptional regulator [Vagococcus fluvialis]|uniref:TetR/AcrR family transcriptional regulator n=1 Tax=Vagococcus fluvialis TaxID=2738 RepID=UPI001432A390|nr:TetR/AcrR family transcriptional regulator [Vagococcus fluvialis]NKC60609.1 TetR/AcrR family transcriptional regulator [Vagococcus fluvialis]NKD51407.1 TetR/AcrR family transcriptional regulator [Vagococcus fluvialis]